MKLKEDVTTEKEEEKTLTDENKNLARKT